MRSRWGGVAALVAVVVVGAASPGCGSEERCNNSVCEKHFHVGAELVEGPWGREDGTDVAAGALVQGSSDLAMATASLVAELTTRCSAVLRLGGAEVPTSDTRHPAERALEICDRAQIELHGAVGRYGARLAAPGACVEEPLALEACEALCAEARACSSCIGEADCLVGCRASAAARRTCAAASIEIDDVDGAERWRAAAEAHLGAIASAAGPRREALQLAAVDLGGRLTDLAGSGKIQGRLGLNLLSILDAAEGAQRELELLEELAQDLSWLEAP